VLRESARKEFENSRLERDPETVSSDGNLFYLQCRHFPLRLDSRDYISFSSVPILQVTRMLVVGRDAVHQIAERFVKKRDDILKTPPGELPPGSSSPHF
jgi:hypothetical protein